MTNETFKLKKQLRFWKKEIRASDKLIKDLREKIKKLEKEFERLKEKNFDLWDKQGQILSQLDWNTKNFNNKIKQIFNEIDELIEDGILPPSPSYDKLKKKWVKDEE